MHTVLLPDGHALTRVSRSAVGMSETVEIYLSGDIYDIYGLLVVRIAELDEFVSFVLAGDQLHQIVLDQSLLVTANPIHADELEQDVHQYA